MALSLPTLVGMHYRDNVDWLHEPWEKSRDDVGHAFRQFLYIDEDLKELDLAAGPGPVVQWLSSTQPESERLLSNRRLLSSIGDHARTALDSCVADLMTLTEVSLCQEPTVGLPPGSAIEEERALWLLQDITPRPSLQTLITGVVEQPVIEYLRGLAASFSDLVDECNKLHTEVIMVRSLLWRGFCLCMDLLYLCRVFEYAYHLNVTELERFGRILESPD